MGGGGSSDRGEGPGERWGEIRPQECKEPVPERSYQGPEALDDVSLCKVSLRLLRAAPGANVSSLPVLERAAPRH